MSIRLACGPLVTRWPKPPTPRSQQIGGAFKVTYDAVFMDIEQELDRSDARRPEAEFDMVPKMFRRLDSRPYATGLGINSHGVLLRFERRDAQLVFACDKYQHWLSNLRAISLTLAALRAVDRYGATAGEQYLGFKRLGTGGNGTAPAVAPLTPLQAAERLVRYDPQSAKYAPEVLTITAQHVLDHPHIYRMTKNIAQKVTHPDSGGSSAAFTEMQRLCTIIDAFYRGEEIAR
jgi:hypothetical protein